MMKKRSTLLFGLCLLAVGQTSVLAAPSPFPLLPERMMMAGPHADDMPGGLRHLQLNEAQQDRVFAIQHEQASAIRKRTQTVRAAQEKLDWLAGSGRWDEGVARTVAEILADETAELALLQARMRQKLYEVLTPEQLQQLAEKPLLPPGRR